MLCQDLIEELFTGVLKHKKRKFHLLKPIYLNLFDNIILVECVGIVVGHQTLDQEILGLIPTGVTVLCPSARHLLPIVLVKSQEAVAPSGHD